MALRNLYLDKETFKSYVWFLTVFRNLRWHKCLRLKQLTVVSNCFDIYFNWHFQVGEIILATCHWVNIKRLIVLLQPENILSQIVTTNCFKKYLQKNATKMLSFILVLLIIKVSSRAKQNKNILQILKSFSVGNGIKLGYKYCTTLNVSKHCS